MRVFQVGALAMLSFAFLSCDADNLTEPAPVTTTTTTALPPAEISVTVSNAVAFVGGQGNAFQFELTMTETAGTGANINFARLELFRATGELEERREVGADIFVAALGDNRLEGGTSETAIVTFFFRATVKRGRTLQVTVGFTDDAGNDLEAVERFVFR